VLPFTQVPHTSPLFLDYLPTLPRFASSIPDRLVPEWVKEEAETSATTTPGAKSLAMFWRTKPQVGLGCKNLRQHRATEARCPDGRNRATGRIIRRSALLHLQGAECGQAGEHATASGVDCVPIFWLATEDHDLAEVNHVSLVSETGAPEQLAIDSHGLEDAPVGMIELGAEVDPIVARATALLGDTEVFNLAP